MKLIATVTLTVTVTVSDTSIPVSGNSHIYTYGEINSKPTTNFCTNLGIFFHRLKTVRESWTIPGSQLS